MLIYSFMKDPFHTSLRMASIIEEMDATFEVDRLFIYDLIISAPFVLNNCKLPQHAKQLRTIKKENKKSFSASQNNASLYFNQKKTQNTAIKLLSGYGLISIDSLKTGNIEKTNYERWQEITEIAKNSKSINWTIIEAIKEELSQTPLYGKNGIKDRFNVMEHKYDTI